MGSDLCSPYGPRYSWADDEVLRQLRIENLGLKRELVNLQEAFDLLCAPEPTTERKPQLTELGGEHLDELDFGDPYYKQGPGGWAMVCDDPHVKLDTPVPIQLTLPLAEHCTPEFKYVPTCTICGER